jgi:hypothetical protein
VGAALEGFTQGVERARADVAVDDAERAECEQSSRRLGVTVAVMTARCFRCFRLGVAWSASGSGSPCVGCSGMRGRMYVIAPGWAQHQMMKAR